MCMAKGRAPAILPDEHATFAGLCRAGLSNLELGIRYRMSPESAQNWRMKLAPETSKRKARGAAAETNDPVTPPSHEDVSEEAAPSVAQSA